MSQARCPHFNNPEFLKEFIQLYQSFPCIWNKRSPDYCNSRKKEIAYRQLIAYCKRVNSSADLESVRGKISNLRRAFRKEAKKVKDSRKRGGMYVPKLWYYDSLKFIIDDELPTESIDCNQGREWEEEREEVREEDDEGDLKGHRDFNEEISYEGFQNYISTENSSSKARVVAKRTSPPTKELRRQLLEKASAALQKKSDEHDAFGVIVSAKLRKMREDQRLVAELLISEVLFKGMTNQLSEPPRISKTVYPTNSAAPNTHQYGENSGELQQSETVASADQYTKISSPSSSLDTAGSPCNP